MVVWAFEGPHCSKFFGQLASLWTIRLQMLSLEISGFMFKVHHLVGTSLLSELNLEAHLEVGLL